MPSLTTPGYEKDGVQTMPSEAGWMICTWNSIGISLSRLTELAVATYVKSPLPPPTGQVVMHVAPDKSNVCNGARLARSWTSTLPRHDRYEAETDVVVVVRAATANINSADYSVCGDNGVDARRTICGREARVLTMSNRNSCAPRVRKAAAAAAAGIAESRA